MGDGEPHWAFDGAGSGKYGDAFGEGDSIEKAEETREMSHLGALVALQPCGCR